MAWMRMMGVDSVEYHRQTVLDRQDDHPGAAHAYYASRGETPLAWGGGGSPRLGLDGTVTPEQYEALFGPGGARDPVTGERLVSTKRPGLELVVSAHKSVAELGVIGRREDMHRILDAEREGTLAYLERLTQERGGRRGRAANPTPTSGLVYAFTRHATSRAGDPCLHDHVLIANLVEMRDERGGWKAADTALWREHLHAATAYGRICSAGVAVELGYGIVADDGPSGRLGHWAIAGIPQLAMNIHSKRSMEIDDALDEASCSYRERAIAARKTRTAKQNEPVEDLMTRWQQELAVYGLDLWTIDHDVERHGHCRISRVVDAEDIDRLASHLLTPDSRLAAEKVFTRRDVIVAAAPHLFGHDPRMLEAVVDRVLSHPDAVPLEAKGAAREPAWAPRCIVETELAIEAQARERRIPGSAPVVRESSIYDALDVTEASLGHRLTNSQFRTVMGVCESGAGLDVVVGLAGSGKTTALEAVRRACEADGLRVLGTATSGQAARTVSRDAGIESYTVASLLARIDHRTVRLDARTIVILDEAGMTDDQDLHRLLGETRAAGTKLVLVGDDRQLSAVGPGGSLGALVERFGGSVWSLSENVRQVDIGERQALAELRDGDVEVAVDWLAMNGRIVTGADRPELIGAVVDGWLADIDRGLDTAMLAWKRVSVDALNELGRQAYVERGWLAGEELIAPGGKRYRAGDRIVTLAPFGGTVVTSETGMVEAVHTMDGSITVRFDDGRCTRLPERATAEDRLAYGYAITVHRSQGATFDTVHDLEDGGGRELAYVGLSRARHRSTIYVEADFLDQAVDDLTQAWAIERRQQWVIDRETPTVEMVRPAAADDSIGLGL